MRSASLKLYGAALNSKTGFDAVCCTLNRSISLSRRTLLTRGAILEWRGFERSHTKTLPPHGVFCYAGGISSPLMNAGASMPRTVKAQSYALPEGIRTGNTQYSLRRERHQRMECLLTLCVYLCLFYPVNSMGPIDCSQAALFRTDVSRNQHNLSFMKH